MIRNRRLDEFTSVLIIFSSRKAHVFVVDLLDGGSVDEITSPLVIKNIYGVVYGV